MKFTTVATSPTIVTAPNFLIHQTVRVRIAKPIMSHRIGSPNIRNTIGAKMEFRTPQRPENRAMLANSRVLK